MALGDNGSFGNFKGKIGNLVRYQLKGKTVVRKIGVSNKPPTLPQLAVRRRIKVVSRFLKPMLAYINLGFEHIVAGTDQHPHNAATSYNTKNAVMGEYPDLVMDYSKALVSMGPLEPAIGAAVSLISGASGPVANGIEFTWLVSEDMDFGIRNDRAMLLVYFPGEGSADFVLSGPQRREGRGFVGLGTNQLNKQMECYIAFTADDRKSVSDSVWVGA
ncbi:DUF6266 family protein [Pedobacter ginsengisoli]|uniref:DUF6266 family protein n=1 Tax=Pedobacter ginsengisoli TaxID=363852 RepID=UPI00254C99E1|nr:DUF6266 family protein [Pedobacter ginsengisoli]